MMIKLLVSLFFFASIVSGFCPSLTSSDNFYCFTDGIQYQPDATCATAYYCTYDSATSISKWAFGNSWGASPNSWSVVTGFPTFDSTSCPGMTLVSSHVPSGTSQDESTAYDANLLMQIWVTADRVPAYNESDIAGECDV